MRVGVVQIELQPIRKVTVQRHQQAVIVRIGLVGDVGVACKLSSQTHIRSDYADRIQPLHRIGEVTNLHRIADVAGKEPGTPGKTTVIENLVLKEWLRSSDPDAVGIEGSAVTQLLREAGKCL